jgi:hypothetical protein
MRALPVMTMLLGLNKTSGSTPTVIEHLNPAAARLHLGSVEALDKVRGKPLHRDGVLRHPQR